MKIFCCLTFLLFTAIPLAAAATAQALIKGTVEGSPVSGKVAFEETAEGLAVTADLENVPPGKHGFHIHETGSCAEGGKAAGGHFNPDGVPHGNLTVDGFQKAHAGDLGNIEITQDGKGTLNAILPNLTVGPGKYQITGKSVILHEKEDTFAQPTGNAGGRIGCGVIKA